MSTTRPLLIEVGTEELPVKALAGLARALFEGVIEGLNRRGIAVERGAARPLYTPRRLAVLLPSVAVDQPDQASEVLGPYLNVALDAQGQPTRALQGFAGKSGVDWTQLERTTDAKGERFVHRAVKPGAKTADLLSEILHEAIAAMPIPKPMRWADHDYGFARPVHWLLVLLGGDIVDAELFGHRADRMSRGHRFMHDKPVWINTPGDYVDALRSAMVLVDPEERRARIVAEVRAAVGPEDAHARIDDGILEEVNGLVEWPKAVACSFDREFLAVPQEALIATMEANQKFFPVLDAQGRLSERFVGVANIASRDETEVRKGYERVIRPRFADAKFFFVEDMKQGLAAMNAGLKTVKYQDKLGTLADKVARVAALAEAIAPALGVDPALARRAAELSKADLQSRLVNEFPELQGTAGRYYAAVENEPVELAVALDEAYRPRFAGDAIAASTLGQVLAVAERLDTLAGGFAAGLKPTGNKDPFALRRNALGLARTLIEATIPLELDALLDAGVRGVLEFLAQQQFNVQLETAMSAVDSARKAEVPHRVGIPQPAPVQIDTEPLRKDLLEFVLDRLRGYYGERGVPAPHFEAVAALAPRQLPDLDARLRAIGEFARLPEAPALAAANKRIRNILRKADDAIPATPDPARYAEAAERDLAQAVDAAIADTDPLLERRDYVAFLARLAQLRPQVDAFFDQVMVNVEDADVRANRLALLRRLSDRLGAVAAIEHLSL